MTKNIFIIFTVIVSGLILTVAVHGEYDRIKLLVVEKGEIATSIANAHIVSARMEELARRFENIPPDVDEKLRVIVPEDIHPARLLADVNAVALRHGLSLVGPSLPDGDAGGDIRGERRGSFTLKFNIHTTYPAFRAFLADLERSLAIRDVTEIAFSELSQGGDVPVRKSSAPAGPQYNFYVTLETYSLN